MARRWRLRHKLMLGLALVLGTIVLLLAGAARGLADFVGVINSTESRFAELQSAKDLKLKVGTLTEPNRGTDQGLTRDSTHAWLVDVRALFDAYCVRYDETLARGRDRDPRPEQGYIRDIGDKLDQIERLLDRRSQRVRVSVSSEGLTNDEQLRAHHAELNRLLDDLLFVVTKDIYDGFHETRVSYRVGMATIITACVLGAMLTMLLMHLFRQWVFKPIRVIQDGVKRVSNAEFDKPIVLDSGDELQELTDAFNEMTGRLRGIYQNLAEQVNDRSRQLVRSERMVSVGFLAAGVAHEINNPLASIAFCGEALERRVKGLLSHKPTEAEEIQRYLVMIQQEAFRCKEITQRLLEFSRAGERQRQMTDLAELIQKVLEIARHLPNCKGKHLVFRPQTRPVAPVNATDLRSVVLNLVVNALDSMEAGGTVTITLGDVEGYARMTVTDTGCGMNPDVLDNIFEPFFTRSRTGKGTGLGLFISHQIIDQHGGRIEAASPGPGMGSTFVVRLPLNELDNDTLPLEQSWARGSKAAPTGPEMTEDSVGNAAA